MCYLLHTKQCARFTPGHRNVHSIIKLNGKSETLSRRSNNESHTQYTTDFRKLVVSKILKANMPTFMLCETEKSGKIKV